MDFGFVLVCFGQAMVENCSERRSDGSHANAQNNTSWRSRLSTTLSKAMTRQWNTPLTGKERAASAERGTGASPGAIGEFRKDARAQYVIDAKFILDQIAEDPCTWFMSSMARNRDETTHAAKEKGGPDPAAIVSGSREGAEEVLA